MQRRWPVLTVIVAVLAVLGLESRTPGKPPQGGPPLSPVAAVIAANAESSAWYCTGQTTVTGLLAPGTVVLSNTTKHRVSGSVASVTDTGISTATPVVVPAMAQLPVALPTPASGTWRSESVILSGGGVAVSQALEGPNGWAEAPCQSGTSQHWYFPSGVTTGSNGMFISLFNPTSTPDVIDLNFVTPSGPTTPINFQGIVLQPGQTQAENVSAYVQNQPSVATTVSTRTGRVVASELEVLSGNGSGLAIVPGSPRPEPQWSIPESIELAGGTSSVDVYNPGSTTEVVTVRTRIDSGSPAPFVDRVLPYSIWVLHTSNQTRIPDGDVYDTVVTATGGSGVVVGRTVAAPSAAPAPQDGMSTAVDSLTADQPGRLWLVPSPGSTSMPAIPNVLPAHLSLVNPSGATENYVVSVLLPRGGRTIALGTLRPFTFISLGDSSLFAAGLSPFLVSSSGPLYVTEDMGPTGTYGVATMPGIPVAHSGH
jgi:hypothetical protein